MTVTIESRIPKLESSATKERRTVTRPIEVRKNEAGATIISGHAAVFYRAGDAETVYALWSDFEERIMPGAFDAALQRKDDTRALFNHDVSLILGRTEAGTCVLSVDKIGLRFEVTLPGSDIGQRVAEAVQRGDITGCSFSFTADKQSWIEEKQADGSTLTIREISDVTLYDVGPVTFPAYEGTDVSVAKRSLGDWSRSRRKSLRDRALRRLRVMGLRL